MTRPLDGATRAFDKDVSALARELAEIRRIFPLNPAAILIYQRVGGNCLTYFRFKSRDRSLYHVFAVAICPIPAAECSNRPDCQRNLIGH